MSSPPGAMADAPDLAGVYCRLSLARMKDIMGRTVRDQTKVEEQERISRRLAEARGWKVAEGVGYPEHNGAYVDNSRSAWQRNRKRPGWDQMLADVEAGKLTHLVIYHGDRLVRQPYDLELLLNLADQRGMIVASPTGEYRLDVPTDRFVLRILTAKACLESDDLSRRKKDGFARMKHAGIAPAASGRYGRGFGYDIKGRIPVPCEAEAIREAARRLLDGHALATICRDFTARGILSTSGQPFSYQTLRRVLTRPRIAGLLADGSPGNWEPILERHTWEMICGVLRARALAANSSPTGTARHLLSGLAECSECGSRLQRSASHRRSLSYACRQPGCRKVNRNMAHLDAYVTGRMVRRLNSPELAEALTAPISDPLTAQITQLETRREETRQVAENLADHPGADLRLLMAAVESFTQRISELRASAQSSSPRRLLTKHQGITREQFEALPLDTRRALISAAYRVVVLPTGRRGPGFDPESIRCVPRDE